MRSSITTIIALLYLQTAFSQIPDFTWAKRGEFKTHDVAYDAAGNVYSTGYFSGTVDFDPSALGVFNLTAATGASNSFILKLNAAGNFVWAKTFVPLPETGVLGDQIRVDALGNIYTTGQFLNHPLTYANGIVDFDPGPGVYNLETDVFGTFYANNFLSKLDASGNFLWAIKMVSDGTTFFNFDVDNSGNIYAAGNFGGTKDFNPDAAGVFNVTAFGLSDAFILKLNTSGDFVWAKQLGGAGFDELHNIDVDEAGNIYTTGRFEGTADFNPSALGVYNLVSAGGSDAFVSKLNSSGNFVWARAMGGISSQTGDNICVDNLGGIITTGTFVGVTDFDPGPAVYNLTPSGPPDNRYILKLTAAGDFVWAKQLPNTSLTSWMALTTDLLNNVYVAGVYNGDIDCDPGAGTFVLTHSGNHDVFTLKLNDAGNFVWAFKIGSTGTDNVYSIKMDEFNNIYTTGRFVGTVDFNPGAAVSNLTAAVDNSFITKLNQSVVPLPIALLSFAAVCNGNAVDIKWATASESNNKAFSIERSADGSVFRPIATLQSGGNSTVTKNYQVKDANPIPGNAFYRLVQTDMDGNRRYFQMVSVTCGNNKNEVSVYPNPAALGSVNIELPEACTLIITNSMGQLISTTRYSAGLQNIKLDQPAGIYFVKIIGANTVSTQQVIVK